MKTDRFLHWFVFGLVFMQLSHLEAKISHGACTVLSLLFSALCLANYGANRFLDRKLAQREAEKEGEG